MAKKQFKAESKKLMELMINSIYTNKDIFLRELISNASDAIDKLHYKSLTDRKVKVDSNDFAINISIDKENRKLMISDNGIGMNKEDLEGNLGTIAKSGSSIFKEENEKKENIDIIGQFGVGFYSAFMVASEVCVISKAYGEDKAYMWASEGIDGYTVKECDKDSYGTDIILTIKNNNDDEDYSKYLDDYHIQSLIKKYSDYITYPIKMNISHSELKDGTEDEYETVIKEETVNSLVPLWKRSKSEITDEEYNTFYSDKFFDYDKPTKVLHFSMEGRISFNALLYIPAHAPYDYYSKEYEKGLQLYSNGVLIMEKCSELLPDYFSFVKGVIDSPDLSLNISRETLQQDKVLQMIAKNIESKITKELISMLINEREKYEEFFDDFGLQLKVGVCNNYGMDKDKLQDLLLFHSSVDKKYTTLKEYVSRMKEEQDTIYYACSESLDKASMLPQTEAALEKGFEILYLIQYGDEFVMQTLSECEGKKFANVCASETNLDSEEDRQVIDKINEENKEMFDTMKEAIGEIKEVRFTRHLKDHPVCLTSEGGISAQMEKVMKAMPNSDGIKATMILEVNENHPIADKLKNLYKKNKEELKDYSKILYAQARLIEGLPIDNPTELSNLICKELA